MLRQLRSARLPSLLPALAALLLASAAAAQTAFTPGDLYIYNPGLMGGSSSAGGIARIDPVSGATSLFLDLQTSVPRTGACVWDPHRKQLIFCGDFVDNQLSLWAADPDGTLHALAGPGTAWAGMTSRGDGIVYMHRNTVSSRFVYLDAGNVMRVLTQADGVTPYSVPGLTGNLDVDAMQYDAATNSLVVAVGTSPVGACGGGFSPQVSVRRLPLSADGTRVVGAPVCHEFDVSSSGEDVKGISPGPGGSVLLAIDTNSPAEEGRLRQYDPGTATSSVFASTGAHPGAAALSGGAWSTVRNGMVILDSFEDLLRVYAAGGSGAGVELVTSMPIASAGLTGDTATILEITDTGCDGAWRPFGAALAGSGGFAPSFSGGGCPEPAAAVQLTLDDVLGGTSGFAFAGLSQASLPFKGGTLHLFPFTLQVPLANVGGAAGVPGAGGLTVPVTLPPDPVLSGLSVFFQAAFVDAGALLGVSLSNGLEMLLG